MNINPGMLTQANGQTTATQTKQINGIIPQVLADLGNLDQDALINDLTNAYGSITADIQNADIDGLLKDLFGNNAAGMVGDTSPLKNLLNQFA